MIPLGGGGASLQMSDQTNQTASQQTRSDGGGAGFRNSPLINVASRGASLSAKADGGSDLPAWLWVVVLAGGGLLAWKALGKGAR